MNTIPYIVADNKIPYLKGILEPYARIDYLSPERINAQTVQDADILLIRTRTKCNRELLDRSRCRYIATATIGYDHIDTDRKSTRLNSSHKHRSRMPSSA